MRASGNLAELEGAAVCLDRRPDPDAHPVEQVVPAGVALGRALRRPREVGRRLEEVGVGLDQLDPPIPNDARHDDRYRERNKNIQSGKISWSQALSAYFLYKKPSPCYIRRSPPRLAPTPRRPYGRGRLFAGRTGGWLGKRRRRNEAKGPRSGTVSRS